MRESATYLATLSNNPIHLDQIIVGYLMQECLYAPCPSLNCNEYILVVGKRSLTVTCRELAQLRKFWREDQECLEVGARDSRAGAIVPRGTLAPVWLLGLTQHQRSSLQRWEASSIYPVHFSSSWFWAQGDYQ